MAEPITWKTLNSAPADLRFLDSAGNHFDRALAGANAMFKQNTDMQAANNIQANKNATQAFMGQIDQMGTPEQVAAGSAALRASIGEAGAGVDQAALRTAMGNQLGLTQQRQTAGQVFQTASDAYQNREANDAALVAANGNDPAALAAIRAQNPSMPFAAITKAAADSAYRASGEVRANETNALQTRVGNSNIVTNASTVALNVAKHADLVASTLLAKQKAAKEKELKNSSERLKMFKENSLMSSGAYGTKEGQANLYAGMKAMGLEQKQQDDIVYNLGKDFPNGLPITDSNTGKVSYTPIPIDFILQQAQSSTDSLSWLPGVSRKGDDTVNRMARAWKQNPDYQNQVGAFVEEQNRQMFPKATLTDGSGTGQALSGSGAQTPPGGAVLVNAYQNTPQAAAAIGKPTVAVPAVVTGSASQISAASSKENAAMAVRLEAEKTNMRNGYTKKLSPEVQAYADSVEKESNAESLKSYNATVKILADRQAITDASRKSLLNSSAFGSKPAMVDPITGEVKKK